jgi:hypothetical protein
MAGEANPTPTTTPSPTTPQGGAQGSASGPGSSGVGGGSGTSNPTTAAPSQAPATQPSQTQAPTTAGGFTAANSPATQATQTAASGQSGQAQPTNIVPQQGQAVGFADQFRTQFGMDVSQAQMLLSLGWRAFQAQGGQQQGQYQGGQQPGQVQPQATPKHPWGIPEFDRGLLQFVEKDPTTGQLRTLPGGPPDAAMRVQQYLEARTAAHNKLLDDPRGALKDIVSDIAKEVALQQYRQQFGTVQAHGQVNSIIEQNREWLFAKDAQGQTQQQFNPQTGQFAPVLSPVGRYYAGQVKRLTDMGVSDPQQQHELALAMTRSAIADWQARQSQAQNQGQQANQNFLQTAAAGQTGNANPQPNPSNNTPGEPQLSSATLKDVMRQRLEKAGVTDQMLRTAAA